ncbi:hypothetical protein [Actinomadura sp. 6N118]|uniref:hypothetical protein n=1 Tax=Actinomadura sp. 6N118 TaxID=3375151 RepID=UPI0037AC3C23
MWCYWRWVFFVNIPIGVAILAGTRLLVEAERHPGRLDVPGAVTGTGGLAVLSTISTTAANQTFERVVDGPPS